MLFTPGHTGGAAEQKRQETEMSKSIRILAVLCAAAFVAACAQEEEEFVVVDPEPISTEPEYTGKYK